MPSSCFKRRLLLAAASGPGVAVVVTVNCFLAKFCSAFAKYLTLGALKVNLGRVHERLQRSPHLNRKRHFRSRRRPGFATAWRRTASSSASWMNVT